MDTRYDVSVVVPQGGYIAKQCPVRAQLNVLQPGIPVEPDEDAQLRMHQGIAFEEEVFAEFQAADAALDWIFVSDSLSRDEAVAQTVAAMEEGAGLIAGGWLPVDQAGRRTGKPDLLIRHAGGYVPVDVKHHLTLDAADDAETTVSQLSAPSPDRASSEAGWSLRKRKDDALQLAHYRRMLQECGHASGSPLAGIIGKERIVVWYDLDAPMWQTPAKSDGKKRKIRTSMEVYSFEFAFRLDIAAVAHQHQRDPSVDLLVLPVKRGECASCPWREICNLDLEVGSGDPSLIPGVRFPQWRTLREHGISDRGAVASLHYPTAALAAKGVDVSRLMETAESVDPRAPVVELLSRSPKQLAAVEAAGLATSADVLDAFDSTTAALNGGRWLAAAIVSARAALGEAPAYARPGRPIALPRRADIEVDVDMENTNDGVYLWGALSTDRTGRGLSRNGYHAFSTWGPLTTESERGAFDEFWEWLSGIRVAAADAGASFAAYCWHEQAENTQMRRIAAADPQLADEVEQLLASDDWIDLMKVFDRSWTTGGSVGLKAVAPLASFAWPVDGPGGGAAMVHHARMVDTSTPHEEAAEIRQWLIDYNRGDVEATYAIRHWLDTEGGLMPVVPTG